MAEFFVAIVLGPLLWLGCAIAFDGVHWFLHVMLRSRSSWLRALAWPHEVHHRWIDRNLKTNWKLRSANIWCHIVPEYLTQLAFTGLLALVLPLPRPVLFVLVFLQTAVFLVILSFRGRDVNHRPARYIDAHPAGWTTPPSYHALHHVWPDAYFSAYTKVVDRIVGGGSQISGRRFGWLGSGDSLGVALRADIELAGGLSVTNLAHLGELDVLVLLDPTERLDLPVESFIEATRYHQLPPEVWAFRTDGEDPLAHHYLTDVRLVFRTLLVPDVATSTGFSRQAARHAIFWIQRDARFITVGERWGLSARRRFRHTESVHPPGMTEIRHRSELAAN